MRSTLIWRPRRRSKRWELLRECFSDAASWAPSPGNFWFRPKIDIYPDLRAVQPGDILLFGSKKSIVKTVQRLWHGRGPAKAVLSQYLDFDESAWEWTHAAVYVDADHVICEAIPKTGVQLANLEDRFRVDLESDRIPILQVMRHILVDEAKGREVARAAVHQRGTKYASSDCLSYFLKGQFAPPKGDQDEKLICSTLCYRALVDGGLRFEIPREIAMTPSFLSQSRMLHLIGVAFLSVDEPEKFKPSP